MRKISVLILTVFILLSGCDISAFAGGRISFYIGGGHRFFPGVESFFHHRKPGRRFFFHLGHFGHRWGSNPRGYYSASPALVAPYPNTPQESFSGTDPSGAFYVKGYRVLPSGWLRIQVEPTDAEVMVDGFPISIDQASGTSSSLGFPVGQHQVEASKRGLQSYQSEVEIKQAREVVLWITLGE